MEQIISRANKAKERFRDFCEYVDSLSIDDAQKSTLKYLGQELAVHSIVDIRESINAVVWNYRKSFPEL